MADPMGSTATGRSPRRYLLCSNPRALWSSNWVPARPPRSAHYFRKRALRPSAGVPTLQGRRAPSSPGDAIAEPGHGHDRVALRPRQKSTWNIGWNRLICGHGIGTKHWCRAALNARSSASRGPASRGLAAQARETRAGTAKPKTATAGSDGKRDRQIQTEKFHRFCALNECRAL